MIYIVNKSTDPAYNIALEEFCFKELKHFDKIFILWINEPAIIVGKHQNTQAEINTRFVQENGIHVVRRITGGGAVYHDLNNLNYTIISNEKEGENDFDFKTFSQPVIETLAELGATAEFSGRNDITIDGKKICGNAQAYAGNRVMHHGCLLFDTDLSVLSKALEVSKETVDFKGVKSVRSRVDNILPNLPVKITVNEFADKILDQMIRTFPEMKEYHFGEAEKQEIEKARREKFANWENIVSMLPACCRKALSCRTDTGVPEYRKRQDKRNPFLRYLFREEQRPDRAAGNTKGSEVHPLRHKERFISIRYFPVLCRIFSR